MPQRLQGRLLLVEARGSQRIEHDGKSKERQREKNPVEEHQPYAQPPDM